MYLNVYFIRKSILRCQVNCEGRQVYKVGKKMPMVGIKVGIAECWPEIGRQAMFF